MQESHRLGALGSYYHVWARGLDRKPILLDDDDRRTFLGFLADVLRDAGARCYAVALMANHYHLLLQTLECALSTVMRRLNFRYARHHNRRYAGTGHVFQGPYGSKLIEDDEHLLTELAYVHLNPVEVGIVRDVDELAEYPWTGHAVMMGNPGMDFLEVDRVLGWLAPSATVARKELVLLLQRCLKRETGDLTDHGAALDERRLSERESVDLRAKGVRSLLGDSERLDVVLRERRAELWAGMRLTTMGWTPLRLLETVCEHLSVAVGDVRQGRRTRPCAAARAVFLYLATTFLGTSASEAARLVGVSSAAASGARTRGRGLFENLAVGPGEFFGEPELDTHVPAKRRS